MNDEINIKNMKDEEIFELMHEDLYDGYAEEIVEAVNEVKNAVDQVRGSPKKYSEYD